MTSSTADIRERIRSRDWAAVAVRLNSDGFARLPRLLSAADCRSLARLWPDERAFRARVDMGRHAYGRGEYRYFAEPLPPLVAALRTHLYVPLARIANDWRREAEPAPPWPPRLAGLRARCRAAGQARPTPLLLRYEAGDYNRLHQDRYGDVWFPLQVVVPLSRCGVDYEGGEFLLVEQHPRQQSVGTAITLARGEGLVFSGRARPVQGARSTTRATVRHGVSVVTHGERLALGVIFHDAA